VNLECLDPLLDPELLVDLALQRCIESNCGAHYGLNEQLYVCSRCGGLLEIQNELHALPDANALRNVWQTRLASPDRKDRSGVWRYRELLPFSVDTVSLYCVLVLNDFEPEAIDVLKDHIEPLLAEITQNVPKLYLQVRYLSTAFEEAYPEIKELLERGEYKNVLFNLDQCGHSKVELETITDIIASFT